MSTLRTNEIVMLDDRGTGSFTFVSVADLKDASQLKVGQKVRTLGYYSPGDGGGNDYEIVAAGTGSNYGFLYEQLTGSGLEAKLLGGGVMENKTVYIPTDYATLQDAVDHLVSMNPANGAVVDLVIESGYVIGSQLLVQGKNASFITISSVDAEVLVNSSGDYPAVSTEGAGDKYPVICGISAGMPTLNCVLDLQATELGAKLSGYFAYKGSSGVVNRLCGVVNSNGNGIAAFDNSNIIATEAVSKGVAGVAWLSGAGITAWSSSRVKCLGANADNNYYGIVAAVGSNINARNSSAKDCLRHAMRADEVSAISAFGAVLTGAGNSGVNCWRGSTIHIEDGDVSNAGNVGIFSWNGSTVVARGAKGTGCLTGVDAIDCGVVDLSQSSSGRFCDFSGCSDYAVRARRGSTIHGGSINGDGCGGTSFSCEAGSTLSIPNCSALSSNSCVSSIESSRVNARNINAGSVGTGYAVLANDNGEVNIEDGTVTTSSGLNLNCIGGGKINAENATVRGSVRTLNCQAGQVNLQGAAIDALEVGRGGIVNANNATGAPSANISPNQVSFAGIVFGFL